ncbi:MAG: DbpA RNA binding domain-containing protein [Gemmatimonadaceae bacterium]
MEQDVTETVGVTRGQNVVYVLPHDWTSIAHFLGPALERLDPAAAELQMVVVTADADVAAAVTGAASRLADTRGIRIVPATTARRAARLLRARPAHVVAGPPAELLALVQGAALKLDTVRVVVLAWADEILAAGAADTLETVLAEIPKGAARVLVGSELTPDVEALIERYARRARRVAPPTPEDATALPISYLSTSPGAKVGALRRLLDQLDPGTAAVFVRSDESERIATEALAALGFGGDDAPVRVTRTAAGDGTELLVLFDLPATHQELRELAGAQPGTIVALLQPRQLPTLRALAAGGKLTPLAFPDAAARARSRDDAVREEIRRELQAGAYGRELLAVEPLLDEYDGIEVAAATLRLLERARVERAAAVAAAAEQASGPAMTRLFVNVGAKDSARPADLVGAIANEGGITRTQIGRVDLRETYSLVDVDAKVASEVAAKLTGTMIRGRRVQARLESDRPPRREHDGAPRGRDRGPGRPGGGSRGPGRGPDRGDRGDRGGPRQARGAGTDRPPRAARPRGGDV